MPRKTPDYCKSGETRERNVVLSDPAFWTGRIRLDVFWTGSIVRPQITAACCPGDYLDIWPEMTALLREKLRYALIRRLNKARKGMTDIKLDIADDEEGAKQIIALNEAVVLDITPDAGAGVPNYTIRTRNSAAARQLIRELYNDFTTPDTELEDLYFIKA